MSHILALDPGTTQTAAVVLRDGKIAYHNIRENAYVLGFVESMTASDPPLVLAVEMIASYGMPVGREVFETCVWIGRFVQAWQPLPVEYVYRREVKLHLCGSVKAKDQNIRVCLIDKYGGKEAAIGCKKHPGSLYGIKSHEWAALAVATYATETMGASR